MPLRLIENFFPENDAGTTKELFENETTLDYWQEESSDGSLHIKLLISADKTEKVMALQELSETGCDLVHYCG